MTEELGILKKLVDIFDRLVDPNRREVETHQEDCPAMPKVHTPIYLHGRKGPLLVPADADPSSPECAMPLEDMDLPEHSEATNASRADTA